MLIRFWGTRGSLPTPIKAEATRHKLIRALMAADGRRFDSDADAGAFLDEELDFPLRATYGGDTSCVELETDSGEFILFDMGSGLRPFCIDAVQRCQEGHAKVYNFFLSHLHWDHIMGFPFFGPAFDPGVTIRVYGGHEEIREALVRQQEKISFPVPFSWLNAQFEFRCLTPNEDHEVAGCRVRLMRQHHDNDSYGFRIEQDGRVLIYTTDAEHKVDQMDQEAATVAFFKDADLVIFDTMYSLGESVTMKEDWGHSSNVVAVDLCHLAAAQCLAMFHHEPIHNDDRSARFTRKPSATKS